MNEASDAAWEREREAARERLKPRLTPEFLATLVEAARVVGWGVDRYEVEYFVEALYEIIEQEAPKWKSYDEH